MITAVEDYFDKGCGRCARFATADCASQIWAEGLGELRALCRSAGLDEDLRWGHPCYRFAGRNIALINAIRSDFRLSLFDAGLLSDPAGILNHAGPNAARADTVTFTSAAQVRAQSGALIALLNEAKGHAEAGRRAAKPVRDVALPEALTQALDADPDLAAAFHSLTPGRQRSYGIALASAKTLVTQLRRIEKFRPLILAGKGALERLEPDRV